eukprot:365303-Chlamydomonas_euryale.AAC.30
MFAASGAALTQAPAHTAQPSEPLPGLLGRQHAAEQQPPPTSGNEALMSNNREFKAANSTAGSASSLMQLFEEWGMAPAESDPLCDQTAAAIQQAVRSAGADNVVEVDAPADLPQQEADPVNIKVCSAA